MAHGFNLLHWYPGPVLILNENTIPLLVKPPAADGASGKIAHISGASIFGGSVTVQPWKKYYNMKGQSQWFVAGRRNF